MKIVLAGGTGFIGRPLSQRLIELGHDIIVLTRRAPSKSSDGEKRLEFIQWDAKTLSAWVGSIDGVDAIINLTGESIGGGRWTSSRKAHILNSRLDATRALVDAIAQAAKNPEVLVNISGVGFYGDVKWGDVSEYHIPGSDFLADVCKVWEAEARKATLHGVRVVTPRLGVVLERGGGALPRMLLPFRLFLGGSLGSGDQWFPWVHREDVIRVILMLLTNRNISGPVNVVAPDAVTMQRFSAAIGKAIHRPSWAHVPGFMLKLILGEMSSMILTGQKAVPRVLQETGYRFAYPTLDGALRAILRPE